MGFVGFFILSKILNSHLDFNAVFDYLFQNLTIFVFERHRTAPHRVLDNLQIKAIFCLMVCMVSITCASLQANFMRVFYFYISKNNVLSTSVALHEA